METISLRRRHLLSVGGFTSIAGCLGSLPPGFNNSDKVSLGTLFVYNDINRAKSVDLQLIREDEVVFEDSVETSHGYESIHPTWSTEPAEYTLLYATDDAMGMASYPEDHNEEIDQSECYSIRFDFDELGEPGLRLFETDESEDGRC